ncbi:hypothetical protein [Acutalibacter caecimuris]|uniref:hypothetical protein n=1 Tax=Acutalibacter caecimuris TaxID=3093657 RepID=UPI002AC8AD42|nr:hypothetical protein [Acutalibacter sp. M00118]
MCKKSPYRLAVETDYRLIRGETIPPEERADIAARILAGARPAGPAEPEGKRALYPVFYVPEEGLQVRSLMGQTAKTKILAGNLYELETLRLLCLLAPEEPQVQAMQEQTLRRLRGTCFGNQDDGMGECFDASLVALRFLCAAAPEDTAWIQSRVDNYNRHAGEKKRPWFPLWYFWLCLSEMPLAVALPEVEKHREELEKKLRRSYVMNSPQDRALHPMLVCMLRNLMGRLPAYGWLGGCGVSVNPKTGRVGLDLAG